MATTGGPNIKTDGLVLALDSYSNIRGFTKFGTSGTNNSHRAIRNLVDKSTTYSLSDTSQLTGGNYFTLYALTYPESGQTPASRNGITAGFNNTSATKLYSHSRDLGYYVFDESTNTWVADSYFNGERISGHVYDTYDGEPDQHQKFQDDYDVIKQFFPNATHIVIGSHASENIDNDADTVTRLKEIGLPDDAVGLGRVECILAGKVNKPHTHHYVRENVSSAVAHMNLRLPLEGVGGATTFNGTSDYINLGSSTALSIARNVSVFAVAKFDSLSGWSGIFGNSNGSAFIHFQLSGGTINVYLYGPGLPCVSSSVVSTNQWTVLGFTFDGTTCKIFKDGVNIKEATTSSTSNISSCSDMGVGKVYSTDRFSDGVIPVVKVYNTTLTQKEITNDFNAYRKRFGI
tara:strand:- start:132 stop:1340 length:1209 start_codon:yes stop_codon:yes gene_type:complete